MRPLMFVTIFLIAIPAQAQNTWKAVNAHIQKIVDNVSKERLESIVRKLESFETRSTISDTTSTTKGVGAARQWTFVMRKTTSPDWEREIYAGNVTQYTMKDVSIDEWVFGVRAIGSNGAESLTAAYVNPPRMKSVYKTLP